MAETTATTGARTHQLKNGLMIVGEPMAEKRAAAWAFLVPSGAATEPEGLDGITSVLEGLSYRGAGSRDARQLSDALDDLGIDRGGGADSEHVSWGGATLGDYLDGALGLFADILRRPQLLNADFAEEDWHAQRDLALQGLDSLEDSPARKMFVQLRRIYFPDSYGRSAIGTREGLSALTLPALQADWKNRILPSGSILALAGGIDWDKVVTRVEELFGDWEGTPPTPAKPAPVQQPVFHYIEDKSTAQQQIGVAYGGVPSTDADFYNYRIALAVLSGGMGARLFTEVREKRGLVYSVSASAASLRNCGFTLAYAGTTPERAQETLDVLVGELKRVAEGVTPEEVERARVGMLSSLIMQEESSRARAGACARDMFMLGRVRSLDEITSAINSVTPATIAAFYEKNPPKDFTVVTLGPKELTLNS